MDELLRAEGLAYDYGGQRVLSGISFAAFSGEFISIIGENGSGKTTLMQLLSGFSAPKQGAVYYNGQAMHKIPPAQRAKCLASIWQNTAANFPFTCFEMIMLGRYPHRARFERVEQQTLAYIHAVMQETDTLLLAEKPVTQISGGEYQRVLLARALAQSPKLLLLDEAMSDLDAAAKIRIIKLLKARVTQGLTVIAVNHDLSNAYSFSDRVIALQNGRIVADGNPQAVITQPLLRTVFGIRAEIIPEKGLCVYDMIAPDGCKEIL